MKESIIDSKTSTWHYLSLQNLHFKNKNMTTVMLYLHNKLSRMLAWQIHTQNSFLDKLWLVLDEICNHSSHSMLNHTLAEWPLHPPAVGEGRWATVGEECHTCHNQHMTLASGHSDHCRTACTSRSSCNYNHIFHSNNIYRSVGWWWLSGVHLDCCSCSKGQHSEWWKQLF